jgi:dihydrodipicolinate synthase/N-acetylneuraminate lyase
MLNTRLSGIIPPIVTPLLTHDELDREGLERLLTRVIDAGCSGVFILGSTGEAPALSSRLRLEMIQATAEIVRGKVTLLVGITDSSVEEAIQLGSAAIDAKADALVTSSPFYFRLSQSDLLRHAEMLTRELSIPLFLYNMPGLTKLVYEPDTVAKASEIAGIAGFKDSSGDLIYLQRVLRLVRGKPNFSVFIGPEELLAHAVLMGADGGVNGGANLFPELYVALFRAAKERRIDDLQDLERQVLELSEAIYRVGDPSTSYLRGLKAALSLQNICSDLPAAPMVPLSVEERAGIERWLTRQSA